jgi:hypothetical protein
MVFSPAKVQDLTGALWYSHNADVLVPKMIISKFSYRNINTGCEFCFNLDVFLALTGEHLVFVYHLAHLHTLRVGPKFIMTTRLAEP